MMNNTKITHLIYDMDGLLLDTEIFYTIVTQKILDPYGKKFTWELKSQMMGRHALESAGILVRSLNLPITPEEYIEKKNILLKELCPEAKPMAGAVKLTEHFKTTGVPQAVATSSNTEFFGLKTKNHTEWFSLFDYIVTGDDPRLKRAKPDPDIFLLAASHLGVSPENCLVFEDAISGVKAAKAAGMSVVAVPDTRMDKKEYAQADQILDSLTEFNPPDWNLPPFK